LQQPLLGQERIDGILRPYLSYISLVLWRLLAPEAAVVFPMIIRRKPGAAVADDPDADANSWDNRCRQQSLPFCCWPTGLGLGLAEEM
jgi:hypothetical protein